ncbi:hypothetical protein LZP85_01090 [Priestia flexa]|jgi:hypothetical protein|uniref:Uncharacterized protein n=1 Tax=Priestia flexa TaxID=86664 RepID=A0A8I1MGT9_9BACI|nr:hypothetical protein [Priestia flexa]MBN8252885.1 hypothetical protein [Priestia flexa]MBN8435306.1 hypothetical protein [Priestia flexa]MCA0967780.1 hypothetical protein [Priestia flexa]RIV13110.1 hypothetical protein D1859_04500 [Priestia flexa]UIR30448.1 hypothetical protein LZP85_01090 [Priestia flexa]
MRIKVKEWVSSLCNNTPLSKNNAIIKNQTFYLTLEEFADQPQVYMRTMNEGLSFGYETVQWDGPIPASEPAIHQIHILYWKEVELLSHVQLCEKITKLLIQTIEKRKSEYARCQFCKDLVSQEHRFDEQTCHSCASRQYGVVY